MKIIHFFIVLTVFSTSCSSMLATRSRFEKIGKEAEATEEELEEAELSAVKRKKILKAQMLEIRNIQSERKIFEKAMQKTTNAFLEEMNEQAVTVKLLATDIKNLQKQTDSLSKEYSASRNLFNSTWKLRMNSIKNLICPSFKNKLSICTDYSNSTLTQSEKTK